MDQLRAVALAHGHPPERIERMSIRDLQLLDTYAMLSLQAPWFGGDS